MGLKEQSSEILNAQRRVDELDVRAYEEFNKQGAREYTGFVDNAKKELEDAQARGLATKVIVWLIIIAIIGVAFYEALGPGAM